MGCDFVSYGECRGGNMCSYLLDIKGGFLSMFRHTPLFLVRRYDQPTERTSTVDVRLSLESAESALEDRRSEARGREEPNDFYLIPATPFELERGKIDDMSGDIIGKLGVREIYEILSTREGRILATISES